MSAAALTEPVAPVVDIKRSALDDGPGIRSVVFFKGCPFRCVWCQNPETLRRDAEVQRDVEACLECNACAQSCPTNRARPAGAREDGECTLCLDCVEVCPADARRLVGTEMTADDLTDVLQRDEVFYRHSGGGVTFSGGEPTLHLPVIGPLAKRLCSAGVDVLVETCGQFPWEPVAEHLLPHVSTIYFDLKLADPDAHLRHVGVTNERVHDNLERLARRSDIVVLPRVPLIPGITTSPDNLASLAQLIKSVGLTRLALLEYNPLWISKRVSLGLDLPYRHERWMSREEMDSCRAPFVAAGLQVV